MMAYCVQGFSGRMRWPGSDCSLSPSVDRRGGSTSAITQLLEPQASWPSNSVTFLNGLLLGGKTMTVYERRKLLYEGLNCISVEEGYWSFHSNLSIWQSAEKKSVTIESKPTRIKMMLVQREDVDWFYDFVGLSLFPKCQFEQIICWRGESHEKQLWTQAECQETLGDQQHDRGCGLAVLCSWFSRYHKFYTKFKCCMLSPSVLNELVKLEITLSPSTASIWSIGFQSFLICNVLKQLKMTFVS